MHGKLLAINKNVTTPHSSIEEIIQFRKHNDILVLHFIENTLNRSHCMRPLRKQFDYSKPMSKCIPWIDRELRIFRSLKAIQTPRRT